jgi:hypothetical protein
MVRQAIETAWISASSGGHSSSYWCQQRQVLLTALTRSAIMLHSADALEKMSCVNQITTRSGDVVDNEECTSFRPELRRFGPMAPRLIGFQDADEGKPQIVIGPVLRGERVTPSMHGASRRGSGVGTRIATKMPITRVSLKSNAATRGRLNRWWPATPRTHSYLQEK